MGGVSEREGEFDYHNTFNFQQTSHDNVAMDGRHLFWYSLALCFLRSNQPTEVPY